MCFFPHVRAPRGEAPQRAPCSLLRCLQKRQLPAAPAMLCWLGAAFGLVMGLCTHGDMSHGPQGPTHRGSGAMGTSITRSLSLHTGPGPGVRGHHLRRLPEGWWPRSAPRQEPELGPAHPRPLADVAGDRHRDQDARPLPQHGDHRALLLTPEGQEEEEKEEEEDEEEENKEEEEEDEASTAAPSTVQPPACLSRAGPRSAL